MKHSLVRSVSRKAELNRSSNPKEQIYGPPLGPYGSLWAQFEPGPDNFMCLLLLYLNLRGRRPTLQGLTTQPTNFVLREVKQTVLKSGPRCLVSILNFLEKRSALVAIAWYTGDMDVTMYTIWP